MEEEGPPPTRWEVELEFVQGLANPMYVHFLAQQKYFEDPNFVRYIEYLDYWRHPPHVKYIAYPNCLIMLTMLKEPIFRTEIAKFEVAKMLMDGFFNKWQQRPSDPLAAQEAEQAANEESSNQTTELNALSLDDTENDITH